MVVRRSAIDLILQRWEPGKGFRFSILPGDLSVFPGVGRVVFIWPQYAPCFFLCAYLQV